MEFKRFWPGFQVFRSRIHAPRQQEGFSRRQAELALEEVRWIGAKEALDVLLDVTLGL